MASAKLKASLGADLSDREKMLAGKIGISIVSGHGTGKDAELSWIYLWLLTCFPFPKGLVTGPTGHQLNDVLWPEIRSWLRKSTARLHEILDVRADRVFSKTHKNEWFVAQRTASAKGSAEEQAETLAGMHADYLIMAVDEASGVQDGVFKPLEGALTGKMNLAIMIGNGTRNNGYFFESHNRDRGNWLCHKWSCEETDIDEVTGTHAMAQYVERMRKKYGTDSNFYRIRVLGEFPIAEPDALIPMEWILDAVDREIDQPSDIPVVLGVDVARFGDDLSAICPRQANIVSPIKTFSKIDTMELVGWVSMEMAASEPRATMVDVIGIGAGVVDRLRELHRGVFGVNVAESAPREDKFCRLRDELWWRVREHFERRTNRIPNDDDLIGELCSIKYKPESNGKIKVESKKELKARGIASPNRADALMLTYYLPDAAFQKIESDAYDEEEEPEKGSWMSS